MAYNNQLVASQMLLEEIWNDPSKKIMYTPRIGTLAAVAKETTARINEEYSNQEKKKTLQLFYDIPYCTGTVADAGTDCAISGTEPDSTSANVTLSRTRSAPAFAVNERKFETSMHRLPEFIANNRLIQEKKALEDLNARCAALLNTVNWKTDLSLAGWSGISDRVGSTTKDILIDPAKFTIGGIAPLVEQVAARLQMTDPFILDSGALWDILYNAKHNTPTDQGKADAMRLGGVFSRVYMDWQMAAAQDAQQRFFLIDRGILAILNRPDWMNTSPENRPDDTQTWSTILQASNGEELGPIMLNTQGQPVRLKADIRTQRKCSTRTEYTQHWALDLSADMVKAPTNTCTSELLGSGKVYTGIVGFRCGNPATSS